MARPRVACPRGRLWSEESTVYRSVQAAPFRVVRPALISGEIPAFLVGFGGGLFIYGFKSIASEAASLVSSKLSGPRLRHGAPKDRGRKGKTRSKGGDMHQDCEVCCRGGAQLTSRLPMLRHCLSTLIHDGDRSSHVTKMIMKLLWKPVVILLLL